MNSLAVPQSIPKRTEEICGVDNCPAHLWQFDIVLIAEKGYSVPTLALYCPLHDQAYDSNNHLIKIVKWN
jgi:hypothetical protein